MPKSTLPVLCLGAAELIGTSVGTPQLNPALLEHSAVPSLIHSSQRLLSLPLRATERSPKAASVTAEEASPAVGGLTLYWLLEWSHHRKEKETKLNLKVFSLTHTKKKKTTAEVHNPLSCTTSCVNNERKRQLGGVLQLI